MIIAMAAHLVCHFYPKECQSSTSSPDMHKTANTLLGNTVFYKSVHCMTIFQIFQCKEAIFCSKAVLLVERLQTQKSQNSKKYNPQKISREQNYTLHVCKRCAVS